MKRRKNKLWNNLSTNIQPCKSLDQLGSYNNNFPFTRSSMLVLSNKDQLVISGHLIYIETWYSMFDSCNSP